MECRFLISCPFFLGKMENMPSTAKIYRRKYCLGDNRTCARFLAYKKFGEGNVPKDLFPNQYKRLQRIIDKGEYMSK